MIYAKTELGHGALQNRSLPLTLKQRSAFIMFDGKRSTKEVLKATAGIGVTPEDVNHLVEMGLLAVAEPVLPETAPAVKEAAPVAAPVAPPVLAAPADPAPAALPAKPAAPAKSTSWVKSQSPQELYSKAYPIATRLTSSLGLRGFRLNLAVEAAGDLEKLRELAPKIRVAVGPGKFSELARALYD